MAVQIKIDQFAKPAGVAGRAREDLDLGVPVTLTAVGGPYAQYQWAIEYKAVSVVSNLRSAAALTAPTSSVTQLTPDIEGTYLISLTVDSGSGLGATEDDITKKTFYAGSALNTNPKQLPRRTPAVGEKREHNVPDGLDPLGNVDGHGREQMRWIEVVKDLWLQRVRAAARYEHTGPNIYEARNIASITHVPPNRYDVVFTQLQSNNLYRILITPFLNAGVPRIAQVDIASITQAGFSIYVFTLAGAASTGSFSFEVREELP